MTHLGALGTPRPEQSEISFDYFGTTVHANPTLGELDYIDFLDAAGKVDTESSQAVGIVKNFARLCIAEGDFEAFWSLAKANRQSTTEVFGVLQAIVEATADRPTERPSSSSDTPETTVTSSVPVSSVLRRLEGRPDLQLLVQQQQEGRAAQAG